MLFQSLREVPPGFLFFLPIPTLIETRTARPIPTTRSTPHLHHNLTIELLTEAEILFKYSQFIHQKYI